MFLGKGFHRKDTGNARKWKVERLCVCYGETSIKIGWIPKITDFLNYRSVLLSEKALKINWPENKPLTYCDKRREGGKIINSNCTWFPSIRRSKQVTFPSKISSFFSYNFHFNFTESRSQKHFTISQISCIEISFFF